MQSCILHVTTKNSQQIIQHNFMSLQTFAGTQVVITFPATSGNIKQMTIQNTIHATYFTKDFSFKR